MHHSAAILESDNIGHGFFGTAGGVSTGIYSSLNCGPGSNDNPEAVIENRRRAVKYLAGDPHPLISLNQIHSADVLTVTSAWKDKSPRPTGDAMVTRQRNLALGILTADCCPVLFADPENGVIGAAHAGWRGALVGVIPNTIKAMMQIGSRLSSIRAGIGPTIAQASYEVGPEVREAFTAAANANARFFIPAKREGFFMFDLPGYAAQSLRDAGVTLYENLGRDTYPAANGFFSYRRRTHEAAVASEDKADYGRQLSTIILR